MLLKGISPLVLDLFTSSAHSISRGFLSASCPFWNKKREILPFINKACWGRSRLILNFPFFAVVVAGSILSANIRSVRPHPHAWLLRHLYCLYISPIKLQHEFINC